MPGGRLPSPSRMSTQGLVVAIVAYLIVGAPFCVVLIVGCIASIAQQKPILLTLFLGTGGLIPTLGVGLVEWELFKELKRRKTPMTAPKRHWFRWSLRTLFVVVTVIAVATAVVPRYWNGDPNELIEIAIVGSNTAKAMEKLLSTNGIEGGWEGSLWYSYYVRRRDAPRACKLIRAAGVKPGPDVLRIADY